MHSPVGESVIGTQMELHNRFRRAILTDKPYLIPVQLMSYEHVTLRPIKATLSKRP